jgi:hypothetical protein
MIFASSIWTHEIDGKTDCIRSSYAKNYPGQTRSGTEGEGEMTGNQSTDPGLSPAERKTLRAREAQKAITDHEDDQKAFHENRERLREERLRREQAAGPMLYTKSAANSVSTSASILTRLSIGKPNCPALCRTQLLLALLSTGRRPI